MKVKELLQVLKELTESYLEAGEWEVVMSKDAEGNRFSPLCETSSTKYVPENSYSGDLEEFDEDMEDPNALCLWPTN
jgi:hypothetical protein